MGVNDHLDARIIDLLVQNGRMPFATVGREVGLSSHAVGQRVRRLLADGAIRGFTAIVAPTVPGATLEAVVDVRLLATTPPARFEQFANAIAEVVDLWFVTGRTDFLVRLRCADAGALNAAVRHMREEGGVAATETRLIMGSS